MPKVFEIISIGNELLIGKVVNSNASYLCKKITELGGFVRRITVVRDDLDEISSSIREAIARNPDYIITTGGLGPTFDDMTLEGVARALRLELEVNEDALKMIKEKYQAINEQLTQHRIKMAKFPRGAIALKNKVGMAPGCLISVSSTKILSLPGVPKEMEAIFEDFLESTLRSELSSTKFLEESLFVFGIKESTFAPVIDEVRKKVPEVYIKSHPKGAEGEPSLELHLTIYGEDEQIIRNKLSEASKLLEEKVIFLGGKLAKKS